MGIISLPTALLLLVSSVQANIIPRTVSAVSTYPYTNSSSTISSSSSVTTLKCCFVVQDTISEEWWQQTSYGYAEVNLTSITTYITKYPNVTSTSRETNIYTTNRTFSSDWGHNPITNFVNYGGGPVETAKMHIGSQPVITGGVTIPSPAAFYVYNSVKIITVAAVTDKSGVAQCAAPLTLDGGFVFENINTNAQAYFHGSSVDGRIQTSVGEHMTTVTTAQMIFITLPQTVGTETKYSHATTTATRTWLITESSYIYTDKQGSTITNSYKPTGTVISLVTPFIYQPGFGATGATQDLGMCNDPTDSENYGYIPRTLIEYLVKNKQYSSQYPGLENCIAGGPSLIPAKACPLTSSTQIALGGDLTESKTIYVNPPGIHRPGATPISPIIPGTKKPEPIKPGPKDPEPKDPGVVITDPKHPDPKSPDSKSPGGKTPEEKTPDGKSPDSKNPDPKSPNPPGSNSNSPQAPPGGESGKSPGGAQNQVGVESGAGGSTPPSATDPPSRQQPGVDPQKPPTKTDGSLGGLIFSIMGGKPSGAPLAPGSPLKGNPEVIPVDRAPLGLIGEFKTIDGKPYVVIPGPTNIPLAYAPAGVEGKITVISGASYLSIDGPATYAAPQASNGAGSIGSTTLIGGVPFVVIPATKIPLSNKPSGLSGGTTSIDGTPYLIISSPTTIAAPAGRDSLGRTTLINGTPFVVIPGSTRIPLSNAPTDILKSGAKTTVLDGTPYLIIPSQTTVALSPSKSAESEGQLTVIIDGSSRLVIAGPTTIPLNSDFPVSGKTTLIGGKTMVIVSGATTVAVKTGSKTASAVSTESETQTQSIVPTPDASKAPASGSSKVFEMNVCSFGLVLCGMLFFVFA